MKRSHKVHADQHFQQPSLPFAISSKSPWGIPKALRTEYVIPEQKLCRRCNRVRPAGDFASARGRLNSWCRDCYRDWRRTNYQKNPPDPKARRNQHLRRKYGIDARQYDELYAAQGGVCAICENPESKVGGRLRKAKLSLCVDHDHDSGEIRGLLCLDCNTGIGLFRHDPSLLTAAIRYLTRYKTKRNRSSSNERTEFADGSEPGAC
jgi:hypothetical protein